MTNKIPESHFYLLEEAYHGVFTTLLSGNKPHASIVWVDWDGECPSINTTKERQKGRNVLNNPKASLIIIDPDNSDRWLSIQGEVEIQTKNALEHLDKLTKKYTKYTEYYGNIYPLEQKLKETRIICKLKPVKVFRDANH